MQRRVGRYVVFEAFARGGMATVHLGRLIADRGFSRLVAIKMLGRGQQSSSVYARALEEEARIASRIRHPNVVQPLDFVVDGDDILVVMEYVHGVPLSQLITSSGGSGKSESSPIPEAVCVAILGNVLDGLHAAHEASDELGKRLGVVHRDVSPQNILVGADGVARLADFGIAKVMRRDEHTETGMVKGKLAYMSPEQLRGLPLSRQADIFSLGAVLAQALTGIGPDPSDDDPSAWLAKAVKQIKSSSLADVVRTATKSEARDRFATAAEMASVLASTTPPCRADLVAERVTALAGDDLEIRSELVRKVEAVRLDSEMPPAAAAVPSPDHALPPAVEPITPVMQPRPPIESMDAELAPESIEPEAFTDTHAAQEEPVTITAHEFAQPPPSLPPPQHDEPFSSSSLRPATTKKQRRGPTWIFLTGLSIVMIGAIVYLRFFASEAPAQATTPEPAVFPPPPPSSSITLDPPSQPPQPLVVTPPTTQSEKPQPTTPSVAVKRPKTTKAAVRPDCNPPFRIDAEGKKHYKPECLE